MAATAPRVGALTTMRTTVLFLVVRHLFMSRLLVVLGRPAV
jgi:hypothetical protein